MRSGDWTHAICDDCWKRRFPERQPHRVRQIDNLADICCYCHIPTDSGIYFREDPALFDDCQHNVQVIIKPQTE